MPFGLKIAHMVVIGFPVLVIVWLVFYAFRQARRENEEYELWNGRDNRKGR